MRDAASTIQIPSRAWPARARTSLAEIGPAAAATQPFILATTVLAVTYNALLAFFSAHGGPATLGMVVAIEIGLLLAALAMVALSGIRNSDTLPLAFLYFTVLVALLTSMIAGVMFVDSVRNVLIIAAFTMLGARATQRTVRLVFAALSVITLLVLMLEISALETYAALFKPAEYLAKTRGYALKEFYEEVGLSIGTIAYEGRFSFGLWDGPRTSSIFLEQVGINCFAIVLMIYLATMWDCVTRWERTLAIVTVVLIMVTNNARMASLLVPVMAAGYFLFPRLPRYGHFWIPAILLTATWAIFQFEVPKKGDDLMGRLAITYNFLAEFSVSDLLGGNVPLTRRAFDTGYGFVIASATIFGAFAYWAYLTMVVPFTTATQRRCAWAMSIYIYLWLLVGGTASFSMKTASLLWFLVGFIRVLETAEVGAAPAARPARAR